MRHYHSFARKVCYRDAFGNRRMENALTPERLGYITNRLRQKGIIYWVERSYYVR